MSLVADRDQVVAADDIAVSILLAAREAIVAYGADVPTEVIANAADVPSAAVYRRFPDRSVLLQAVAIDVLQSLIDELEMAIDEEASALAALTRFLHSALDHRVGAIMPAVDGRIAHSDPDMTSLVSRVHQTNNTLFERARSDGAIRPDAEFGDLLVVARLSRPTVGELVAPEQDLEMAHRQLDIFLAGLRSTIGPLPDSGLSFADVGALLERRRGAAVRS